MKREREREIFASGSRERSDACPKFKLVFDRRFPFCFSRRLSGLNNEAFILQWPPDINRMPKIYSRLKRGASKERFLISSAPMLVATVKEGEIEILGFYAINELLYKKVFQFLWSMATVFSLFCTHLFIFHLAESERERRMFNRASFSWLDSDWEQKWLLK